MKNFTIQSVFVTLFLLISCMSIFGFGGSNTMATAEPLEPIVTEKMKALTIPIRIQPSNEIQQVPLFSEKYAQTPVARVNEEPITLQDFTLELATMHSSMGESKTQENQNYTKMLDRLIAIKLIKQEALNIGFDQTPAVKKKIEDYKRDTLISLLLAKQLLNIQPDEAVVKELYEQMALEVKLLTYSFHTQEDAEAFLLEIQNGEDFKNLADKMVAAGKAKEGGDVRFVALNELYPNAAKAAFNMKVGAVSDFFKGENEYFLFRLEDRRIYEDPEIRLAAEKKARLQQANKVQIEYIAALIDKYATFHDEMMDVLDFNVIVEQEPGATEMKTLEQFKNDQRSLVTITMEDISVDITVAEVAGELKSAMYHGIDKPINPIQMNNQKIGVLKKKLNMITGKMEAERLNIHTSPAYLERVNKYEEEVLFDTFLAKAVLPGLEVAEEDVRRYYYSHLEDYSSPLMLKMKSLVFTDRQSALEAQKKLREGSDFKWVSANMTGLAPADNKAILNLGDRLLTITALPENLHELVENSKQGDIFVYSGKENLYYTLVLEALFPPKAKLFAEVRQEAGKVVYGQKINEALEEWVIKLKEAYEVKVFIVQNSH